MNTQHVYCRLCAEPKPSNIQVELQSDAEQRNEIIQKLSRINASTEFHYNNLPTTVCRDCIGTLNKCFDFVLCVEQAQKVLLKRVAQPIVKIEVDELPLSSWKNESYFDDKNSTKYDTSIHIDVKVESDSEESFKIGVDDHDITNEDYINMHLKTESTNEDEQPPKPKKKQIPDSIPLYLDKTWADYNWKCTYCECEFPTITELQRHAQDNHNACNPYRCTDCNFRKARLDKFLNHIKSHHNEFHYSCYRCFAKFKSTTEARRHKVSHINTKFWCPGCKSTFHSESEQKLHTDTYYQVQKKGIDVPQVLFNGLTCIKCSKTFKNITALKSHILYMHTDRKKNFVCETCGKICFDKSSLTQHAFAHTDDRPHKCPICKLGFKTIPVLKDHLGRHNKEKPFSCDQCGSCFRLRRDLKKHRAIHSDGTPFQCKFCSKRFARKQYLTNHERLHSGVKPYSCDICDHSYADWANYNKHMKQRHNIDTSKKKVLAASVNKS